MPESQKKSVADRVPLLKEFHNFAMRGSVIDLAVGVIIGAAFGQIVNSLVTNVVMPPLSLLTGDIDLSHRVIILSRQPMDETAAVKAHVPMITYGTFLNSVISFLIVSFTIFLCVRTINKIYRKPAPPAPAPTKDCPFCCSSIPLPAKRCPQCTSMLDGTAPAAKV
jgi:large conductance mechanosensitive channel